MASFDYLSDFLAAGTSGRASLGWRLNQHRRQATTLTLEQLNSLNPGLFDLITDFETLHAAARELKSAPERSPGPTDIPFHDLGEDELAAMCRHLQKLLTTRKYRPRAPSTLKIPKPGKPGKFREITIQAIEDRVVAKAVQLVLGRLVGRRMLPFVFGVENRGRERALAIALHLAQQEKRYFWVAADVQDAFPAVPHDRFDVACKALFQCSETDDLMALIKAVSQVAGEPNGLRQGPPASPIFFNLYCHAYLDEPWRQGHSDTPLFRYVDDLLVMCKSKAEAEQVSQQLADLAESAGLPLKPGIVAQDVRQDQVSWIGYGIKGAPWSIGITELSWTKLKESLSKTHELPASPLRADRAIQGWVRQHGPVHAASDRAAIVERVRKLASAMAFDEITPAADLLRFWDAAAVGWTDTLAAEGKDLMATLQAYREGGPKPIRRTQAGKVKAAGKQKGATDVRGAQVDSPW